MLFPSTVARGLNATTIATTAACGRIPAPTLRSLSRPLNTAASASARSQKLPVKTVSGARFASKTTTADKPVNLDWIPSNMATAKKIFLSSMTDTGVWSAGITDDSARMASEVLQEDLEKHHVYFNNMGFHSTSSHLYVE